MNQPKEIESKARKVFKSSRIGLAKAQIERAGGEVHYICADVSDSDAFLATLERIKNEYSRIDGVFHAAGIIEDKLFRDKTVDSFKRVYNTKTIPLNTVLKNLIPGLKLLVLFSSISAKFGNSGQIDYSAGNSVLDSAARILSRINPELKIKSFNWGPWKGAGMVGDGVEKQFRKRGISFIDLDKGVEFFANEIEYGEQASILALAGDEASVGDYVDSLY
jgi:NADP-dependent 3-hydroxy acid dehydrogenase YdfG